MSIRRTLPAAPKSIVAVARGPTPSHEITVPRPYLSWLTRSPTSSFSATVSFQPLPNDGVPDEDGEEDRRPPQVVAARGVPREPEPKEPKPLLDGSSRRQSTRSGGNSSRNREAGFIDGWPHAERVIARETYRRFLARVIATYASRRSSASSVGSPSARMCGKTPSSQPVQNTTGYSRPFAVCTVISVTTPAPPSPSSPPSGEGTESASATSDTRSRNAGSDPGAGTPGSTTSSAFSSATTSAVISVNSRATVTSSSRFSTRVWSCGSSDSSSSTRYPVLSSPASRTSCTSAPSATSIPSSSSIATNPPIAL